MVRLILTTLLIIGCAVPVWAEDEVTEHTPNVHELAGGHFEWPPPLNPEAGRRYLREAAFGARLMVTSIQGGHAKVYTANDIGESGIGIFRINREGSAARHLGVLRCHSLQYLNVWGDLVIQGTSETSQTSATGSPSDPCDQDGLRIIDISNPRQPRAAHIIPVPCGVGPHALMPADGRLYIYAPGTCRDDADTPTGAGVFAELTVFRVFPDRVKASKIVRSDSILPLNGCEEFTVHVDRRIGACIGDARLALFDLSDPAAPALIDGSLTPIPPSALGQPSLAFSWDGSLLAWGNGTFQQKRTGQEISVRLFDIEDSSHPVEVGQWGAPVTPGTDGGVKGLGFVPMKDGRQVLSIAHGHRGFHLLDVTDASAPESIAYYYGMDPKAEYQDESALPSKILTAYWYNGGFYLTEARGRIRILQIDGFNRKTVHYFRDGFNPKTVGTDFV